MAGVKGRSGGPRANSGGARPGAGRKPKPPPTLSVEATDSLHFLRGVMTDSGADARLRVRAAIALAQYEHTKTHDGGKKEEQQRAAEKSASRFKVGAPPLRVVGGSS